MHCLGRLTLVLGLVLSASACNTYKAGIPLPDILDEINATLDPETLILQPGDTINVGFRVPELAEEYDGDVRLGPDGIATFPGLVEIKAAGMTLLELDETLERLIEESVPTPDLEIKLIKLDKREVVFIGAMRQHMLSVLPNMRIDFIESMGRIAAEGTSFTLLESVVLIRWMRDEQRRRFWIIDAQQRYWTTPELLYLQAGDIVYFPTHPIKAAGDWVREITRLIPIPQIFQFG